MTAHWGGRPPYSRARSTLTWTSRAMCSMVKSGSLTQVPDPLLGQHYGNAATASARANAVATITSSASGRAR
jgi:hypothetical protein